MKEGVGEHLVQDSCFHLHEEEIQQILVDL